MNMLNRVSIIVIIRLTAINAFSLVNSLDSSCALEYEFRGQTVRKRSTILEASRSGNIKASRWEMNKNSAALKIGGHSSFCVLWLATIVDNNVRHFVTLLRTILGINTSVISVSNVLMKTISVINHNEKD
jgi:hypothetical protein